MWVGEQSGEGENDEGEGLCRVAFKLTRDLNKRLDKYLTDRITFMSRTQLQGLIEAGLVTVNARTPKASTKLRLDDEVEVALPPPPSKEIQGEDIPIDVLFEDEAMIVLNKRPDIIVHPARSHHSGTLLNALVHHFAQQGGGTSTLSSVGEDKARPGVVHRLDRRTSGVMVVAKDDEAHWKLGRQFENRAVDKRYLALVQGNVEVDADHIELPIGPSPSKVKGQREKMVVRYDELGKHAHTVCRVRQRFSDPSGSGRAFTLVELELKTGRTHQIRVHMTHRGHPLVGDDMYEGDALDLGTIDPSRRGEVFERQALHAALLGIHHPATNEKRVFTAPLHADMLEVVRVLRKSWDSSEVLTIPGATVDLDEALP